MRRKWPRQAIEKKRMIAMHTQSRDVYEGSDLLEAAVH